MHWIRRHFSSKSAKPPSASPGYSFRIRIVRSPAVTIQTDQRRIDIPLNEPNVSLSLRASGDKEDASLKDSFRWVLIGEGYKTEDEAKAAGEKFSTALLVALTKAKIGVDLGEMRGKTVLTNAGAEYFSKQLGARVLQDVPGLSVFESEPKPKFIKFEFNALIGRNAEQVAEVLKSALLNPHPISEENLLSHKLFHASMFQTSVDLRFLLLVMAIEALLTQESRPENILSLVDQLEKTVAESQLSSDEKTWLTGSVRQIRMESIGQAGRRLMAALPSNKTYNGMSPAKFWSTIYATRSNLVHANSPRPSSEKLSAVVADLETLVADLLTMEVR